MNKILFIIPAHNESANIAAVLKEIKQDVDFADILVIDDYSSDNTAEIVAKEQVPCVRNIFNLGYAWAVQTGIKYAAEHGYEHVIQFDADGQHVAKEAVKLYDYATTHNTDIVIGSRYLKKTDYDCPFFRKLGTVVFAKLIKLFCHKKITDPLSGFQCLNRRVIECYAKMGAYPEFPDANLIIDMLYHGYSIHEISVKMRLRQAGESMHRGIWSPIAYMINMVYAIFFVFIKNLGTHKEQPK